MKSTIAVVLTPILAVLLPLAGGWLTTHLMQWLKDANARVEDLGTTAKRIVVGLIATALTILGPIVANALGLVDFSLPTALAAFDIETVQVLVQGAISAILALLSALGFYHLGDDGTAKK